MFTKERGQRDVVQMFYDSAPTLLTWLWANFELCELLL